MVLLVMILLVIDRKTDYYDILFKSQRYTISMSPSENDPLIDAIVKQLEQALATAAAASQEAHSSATHSENIADNKYDTLAVEAAYLAHGQSIRISELQETINLYKRFRRPEFTPESPVQLGVLVDVESEQGQIQRLFIGPAAGGHIIKDNKTPDIHVVTISTPIGQAMLNKFIDDEITLKIHNRTEHFTIIDLQ